MESCTFTSNSADDGGGVYIFTGSTATMESCTFSDNSASYGGGGVFVYGGSTATMDACTFSDNSAIWGGGVYIYGIGTGIASSTATMESCTFTNNSADVGGGVYIYYDSNATIVSCTFSDNSASYGGGVYVYRGSTATMDACNFSDNSASYGGGVDVSSSSTAIMESCTFSDNSASYGGGVYVSSSSNSTMESCTFSDNSASGDGGGVYVYSGSTATMDACTITNNSASSSGGGIASVYDPAVRQSSTLQISSCTFTLNKASKFGGAVYSSAQVEDDSSYFATNEAGTAGGAVFIDGDWVWRAEWGTRFSDNTVSCCYSPSESTAYGCSDVNGQRTGENICCGASTTFVATQDDEVVCSACPTGYNCDDPGARPQVLAGYWIALNYSLVNESTAPPVARECWFSGACSGGDPLDQSKLCREHYEGPVCAVCAPNYYSGAGFECRACPAHSVAVVACSIVAVLIVFVLCVLFVVLDLHGAPVLVTSSRFTRAWARLRNAPYGKLRIPIVVLQIISQFAAITGVQYPTVYQRYLSVIGAVGLSVDWVGALTCAFSTDFYSYLLLVTITPIAIVALLALSLLAAWRRTRRPISVAI